MSQLPPGPPGTHPEYDVELFAPLPVWPKVVGILSIVWGSLGLVCGGLGSLLTPLMSSWMTKAAQGYPLPPTMAFGPVEFVFAAARALVGGLLLLAGIMLVSRNATARPLHLFYALVAMCLVATGSVWAFIKNGQMAQYVADYPDSPLAMGHNAAISLILLVVAVLVAMVWPLFCLIWFGLVKRRPEDMTGTALPPAA